MRGFGAVEIAFLSAQDIPTEVVFASTAGTVVDPYELMIFTLMCKATAHRGSGDLP